MNRKKEKDVNYDKKMVKIYNTLKATFENCKVGILEKSGNNIYINGICIDMSYFDVIKIDYNAFNDYMINILIYLKDGDIYVLDKTDSVDAWFDNDKINIDKYNIYVLLSKIASSVTESIIRNLS